MAITWPPGGRWRGSRGVLRFVGGGVKAGLVWWAHERRGAHRAPHDSDHHGDSRHPGPRGHRGLSGRHQPRQGHRHGSGQEAGPVRPGAAGQPARPGPAQRQDRARRDRRQAHRQDRRVLRQGHGYVHPSGPQVPDGDLRRGQEARRPEAGHDQAGTGERLHRRPAGEGAGRTAVQGPGGPGRVAEDGHRPEGHDRRGQPGLRGGGEEAGCHPAAAREGDPPAEDGGRRQARLQAGAGQGRPRQGRPGQGRPRQGRPRQGGRKAQDADPALTSGTAP
ncbi:hypothetical protein SBRY_20732 [Actinacidiphila bryophytorum]|uniref:Uncharacterized protein n=1 Tax=Actinacidiphila bryophytorum TaxID=1436133 RepID=A0A9W4GZR9_9ACTN|nr:hypothetical protein SBRY_20732 [Actinacidiphila bryophytorum]